MIAIYDYINICRACVIYIYMIYIHTAFVKGGRSKPARCG